MTKYYANPWRLYQPTITCAGRDQANERYATVDHA
jgi:hypothetical protein